MVKCTYCDNEFNSEDALRMHQHTKHPQTRPKVFLTPKSKKGIKIAAIFLVTIAILLVSINLYQSKYPSTNIVESSEIPTGPIHWHPHLTIIIDGKEQAIPPNIGLDGPVHSPIHTHDPDGIIHLENNNPTEKTMRLGTLFELWGKEFNQNQIFQYTTEQGNLSMSVNGETNEEFENYILKEKDNITIEYISNSR